MIDVKEVPFAARRSDERPRTEPNRRNEEPAESGSPSDFAALVQSLHFGDPPIGARLLKPDEMFGPDANENAAAASTEASANQHRENLLEAERILRAEQPRPDHASENHHYDVPEANPQSKSLSDARRRQPIADGQADSVSSNRRGNAAVQQAAIRGSGVREEALAHQPKAMASSRLLDGSAGTRSDPLSIRTGDVGFRQPLKPFAPSVAEQVGQMLKSAPSVEAVGNERAAIAPFRHSTGFTGNSPSKGEARAAESNEKSAGTERSPESDAVEPHPFDQLVRSIRLKMGESRSSARLVLEPPELGGVVVDVRMENGAVRIDVRTETEAARSVLEGRSEQLRRAMESHGIPVERFDVRAGTIRPKGPLGRRNGFESAESVERSANGGRISSGVERSAERRDAFRRRVDIRI